MSEDSETPSGLRKALNLSPATVLHVKLGTLYTVAGALISAAIFVWGIKSKVDQTYDEVAAMRSELKQTITHTAILWDEHERYARKSGP